MYIKFTNCSSAKKNGIFLSKMDKECSNFKKETIDSADKKLRLSLLSNFTVTVV